MNKAKRKPKSFYKILEASIRKEAEKKEIQETIDLGATVVRLRRERKLSATELCEKSRDLNPKTLSAIETGRIKNPSMQTLKSLVRGLGITISDLFRFSEAQQTRNLYVGNQKGFSQIDFPSFGIKAISFTPFVEDFFCGKLILSGHKKLDRVILNHSAPIYLSVLVGRIEGRVADQSLLLKEGDNLFFNGILEHTFYNPLEKEAAILLITAPSFL